MHSQPPPKGSLEELFRHHLLESEAAAVPPRPLLWDQIDNSLLLAENEKYRRRLLVHRWGMAASLLLAAMAGGGWWHSQQAAAPTLASAQPQREAARRAVAGAVPTANATRGSVALATTTTSATASTSTQRDAGAMAADAATTGQAVTGRAATATSSNTLGTSLEQAASQPKSTRLALAHLTGHGHGHAEPNAGTLTYATAAQGAGRSTHRGHQVTGAMPAHTATFSSPNADAIAATTTSSSVDSPSTLAAVGQPGLRVEAALPEADFAENPAEVTLADSRMGGEANLSGRLATLAMAPTAGLPAELALKELPAPVPTLRRNWRYGAEYAISAFQPNIDFNRSTADYNTALGFNTVSLTRAAAAEYRANLRPGLSQRLTVRATRWLGGHWSLSTGVEVAQQEAYSATSAAFTGEQLADLSSFATGPGAGASPSYASRDLHDSSFRYRSMGIPVELQYDNQAKAGLSFYGRLGAIVSALLSVRSEVAGSPEATRTYSFASASTPYRRITALLRGSAGVRYRPAGRTWGLNVGPTAEAGVQSLNAETDRSFLQQRRPYSVGIEAGIEFGGGLKVVQ
ncbi:MAG: hypothetical protein ACRYFZ_03455 [Janthinobacterium lividum]